MGIRLFLLALWASIGQGFVLRARYEGFAATHLGVDKLQAPHIAVSRRTMFQIIGTSSTVVASWIVTPTISNAATGLDLEGYLYKIIRVREATQQERRLISTGKFKDKARQNVKLAVKFMIQNYQLSDSVVGASAYLQGNAAQMRAIDVGQAAVQNLQTILEYFDSSDVENIKVDNLSGKETLVIKGLESAQAKIDDFLSYFPEDTVTSVRKKIQLENELNVKEFDPSLGDIINLPPPS